MVLVLCWHEVCLLRKGSPRLSTSVLNKILIKGDLWTAIYNAAVIIPFDSGPSIFRHSLSRTCCWYHALWILPGSLVVLVCSSYSSWADWILIPGWVCWFCAQHTFKCRPIPRVSFQSDRQDVDIWWAWVTLIHPFVVSSETTANRDVVVLVDRGAHRRQSINPRLGFHISWLLPKFVHQSANKSIRFSCFSIFLLHLHFFHSVLWGKLRGLYCIYFSCWREWLSETSYLT